eukprot:6464996-Alexandrium_andersonii.AAC.1
MSASLVGSEMCIRDSLMSEAIRWLLARLDIKTPRPCPSHPCAVAKCVCTGGEKQIVCTGAKSLPSLLQAAFATSDPLDPRLRWRIRSLRENLRRTHPSGAPGTSIEAVLGSAQFELRTPGAVVCFPEGGCRMET